MAAATVPVYKAAWLRGACQSTRTQCAWQSHQQAQKNVHSSTPQSITRSPVANKFQTTVPTRYRAMATPHTSFQLPFCRILPVTAVPRTPARTPAVLLMPRSTPAYLGPISCVKLRSVPRDPEEGWASQLTERHFTGGRGRTVTLSATGCGTGSGTTCSGPTHQGKHDGKCRQCACP